MTESPEKANGERATGDGAAPGSADSRDGHDQAGAWAATETNPRGSPKTFKKLGVLDSSSVRNKINVKRCITLTYAVRTFYI